MPDDALTRQQQAEDDAHLVIQRRGLELTMAPNRFTQTIIGVKQNGVQIPTPAEWRAAREAAGEPVPE